VIKDKLLRARATTASHEGKNQVAYRRFMEIEKNNRLLLHNLGKIAQNKYSSDVKTLI
jgi:hypothetical protein